MTSSAVPRRRRRLLASAVAVATAVVAGTLTPLIGGPGVAAALEAPPVVGPADAGPVLKEVVLDWAPVPGAQSYVVQVGTDEEWSNDPTLERTTVASRLTLPTWLPHASYVWRVAAVGPAGQGPWSELGTFTRGWSARSVPLTPIGTSPLPRPGVPTFSWTPVPTASEYQLQVSDSPFTDNVPGSQADVVTESCFTTRTSVTPFNGQAAARNDGAGECVFTLLGTGEPRWWRVRPLDHVADGAIPEVDTTPVVDEGVSSLPPAPADDLDTGACPGREPDCQPAHPVEKGLWSPSVQFTDVARPAPSPVPAYVDLTAPDRPMPVPTLSADVCSGTVCRDFPTVSWPAVPGAQAYRVYVALDDALTNIQEIAETPGTSWTPTAQWRDSTAGSAYRVVVQACTTEASTDPAAPGRRPGCDEPSAPATFRKSSARLAQAAPADAAVLAGREVVLRWQSASSALSAATGRPATSEAAAYRVQVTRASNPGFAAGGLVDEAVVDATHHVAADRRYADGDHLWRVQAIDASGHRSPWSATRSFRLDSTAPTSTVLSAGRLPATGAVTVAFSEPVTGVSTSSVRMSGVLASVTLAADGRSARLAPGRTLLPGATHVVQLTSEVRDLAGNPLVPRAVTASVDPLVDDRSPVLVLGGAWRRLAATNAVAGTWSRSLPTPTAPTSASVVVHGRGAEVKACVGPASGYLDVWVDGRRVTRVDGYRSYSGCGVVVSRVAFATTGPHRVEVKGLGAKSARSTGTAVAVDAVTAVR